MVRVTVTCNDTIFHNQNTKHCNATATKCGLPNHKQTVSGMQSTKQQVSVLYYTNPIIYIIYTAGRSGLAATCLTAV